MSTAVLPQCPPAFRNIFSTAPDHSDPSEKTGTQPFWSDRLQAIFEFAPKSPTKFTNIPIDRHKYVSIGTRKPDTVHYVPGTQLKCVTAECNIVMLGDTKKLRSENSNDFTDEEKGHLVDFLIALLKVQTFRTPRRARGYLTDGVVIQFFEVELDASNVITSFDESKVMEVFADGADWLYHCLVSSRE